MTNERQPVMSKNVAVQTKKIMGKNVRLQTEETKINRNTEETHDLPNLTDQDDEIKMNSTTIFAGVKVSLTGGKIVGQSQGAGIDHTPEKSATNNHRVVEAVNK